MLSDNNARSMPFGYLDVTLAKLSITFDQQFSAPVISECVATV